MVDTAIMNSAPVPATDVVKALALETPEETNERPSFEALKKGSKSMSHLATDAPETPSKKRKSLKKRFGGLVKRMSSVRRNKNKDGEVDPAVNASFETAETAESTGVPSSAEDKISQDGDKVRLVQEWWLIRYIEALFSLQVSD